MIESLIFIPRSMANVIFHSASAKMCVYFCVFFYCTRVKILPRNSYQPITANTFISIPLKTRVSAFVTCF